MDKETLAYEERVTVFIDILGFKEMLSETISSKGDPRQEKINEIVDAYRAIRDVWDLDLGKEKDYRSVSKNSKRITTFSDCLVISFKTTEKDEVMYTLLEIKWMIMRLVDRGILCRGAITHGKLIHTEEILFGPALAEAYILESKAAMYPRVILHADILKIAKENRMHPNDPYNEDEELVSLLEKDTDGMYYIDYFAKAQEELDDPEYDFPSYMQKLGDKIRKGLMGSSSIFKSDIKVKYRWMKERYNRLIDQAQNKDFLKRLEKQGDHDLARAYRSFKKINPYD
ncbi:MAG TPA: hypothetical protein VHA56_22265 [Mucilaginibacter sp.]|nr:hypothetical protein [Mucilaginibacter sp.]